MSRHVVIVQSRHSGYVFETYGPYATEQKAAEAVARLYAEGKARNDCFGHDHRIEQRELRAMPRARRVTP